jgi:hypothetical protein
MNLKSQLKNITNLLIKVHFIPPISQNNVQKINNNITKSISYHNVYKNFNVEKYMEDEKKYIKKMIKYYNS